MVTITSGLAATGAPNATHPPHSQPASNELEAAQQAAANSPAGLRAQQNAQILQASMDVSISAGNQGLTLLYRTAIDKINEELAPTMGPDAIAQAQQQDQSSEAVAGRIVSMATALYERFAQRYSAEDAIERVHDFVATIRSGFEQGYGEARNILEGLGVWGEDSPVRSAIERTYTLVHQGLDAYLEQKLAEVRGTATEAGQPAQASADAAPSNPSA